MTEFVFAPGGADELTIDESEIISHTPVKTHTGMGTLRAQLATTEDLLPYAQRKDRINVNIAGSTEWTGLLVKPGKTQSDGITSIKAFGIAKKLEESRPDYANEPNNEITISQTALDTAIRNYWPRTPFSASVTDQQTEIVKQDADIQTVDSQTEWTNSVSIPATNPAYIDNGKLKLAQTAFVTEAEDVQSNTVSRSDFSNGKGAQSGGVEKVNDNVNLNYTIEDSDIGVAMRYDVDNGTHPGFELRVDGDFVSGAAEDALTSGVDWFIGKNTLGGSYSGSTSFGFYPVGGTNSDIEIDVIVLYDTRENPTFPDTLTSNGYLSGPALFPSSQQVTLDSKTVQRNAPSAELTLTINDTSNNQSLAVSNDGGSTFSSESNTDQLATTFSDPGRDLQTRVTLSKFGSRTTATPTQGFNGQEVDLLDLNADLNDRVVIDELTLTGNHFENLQELHEYGNFQWTIEHSDADIRNLTVVSYQEGDETRPTPAAYSTPIGKKSSVDSTNYYNALYLRGAEDSNGNYPTAEVEDTQEINDIGDRIDTELTDPNVTTSAGAQFRAQALLDALTDENDRRGEITIPLGASITHPGYARSIDFGDGSKLKTIEEVRLREGTDGVEQTHIYTPPDNVAGEIEQLRRETRQQRG